MTINVERIQRSVAHRMNISSFDPPKLRFAFYGRVSTEDQQDPVSSRNWQLSRASALIEPVGGILVPELVFFDIGHSRSLPWKRRPEAAALLRLLADPDRGFDAVVIGEPQRAFYDNQYSNTMPVFHHYGVQLWVPEVGGAINAESEAHDIIMGVFGGMSKGERTRIKIRVRSAMSAQAKIEGRYLGGRPPYGYQLVDTGPHPNPAKAADGKRLRQLETHPVYADVVRRIFQMYQAGIGYYAIAEILTKEGIPSPSAADRARNKHRTGEGWGKSAVKNILDNPRYTGYQVWGKQRKAELLMDVADVTLGYETKFKWNDRDSWVWSDAPAHEGIITQEDFEAVHTLKANPLRGRDTRTRVQLVQNVYILRGLVFCGLCGRKMQSHRSHGEARYRCRYPNEYALAKHIEHPRNVYIKEADAVGLLDEWLLRAFEPSRIRSTFKELAAAHTQYVEAASQTFDPQASIINACDGKLARYRTILDGGGDPDTIMAWIAEVTAERQAALARQKAALLASAVAAHPATLDKIDLEKLIDNAERARAVIRAAEREDKAAVYQNLGINLTWNPAQNKILVEAKLNEDQCGALVRVRGGT